MTRSGRTLRLEKASNRASNLHMSKYAEVLTTTNPMHNKILEDEIGRIEKKKQVTALDHFMKQRQFFIDKVFDTNDQLRFAQHQKKIHRAVSSLTSKSGSHSHNSAESPLNANNQVTPPPPSRENMNSTKASSVGANIRKRVFLEEKPLTGINSYLIEHAESRLASAREQLAKQWKLSNPSRKMPESVPHIQQDGIELLEFRAPSGTQRVHSSSATSLREAPLSPRTKSATNQQTNCAALVPPDRRKSFNLCCHSSQRSSLADIPRIKSASVKSEKSTIIDSPRGKFCTRFFNPNSKSQAKGEGEPAKVGELTVKNLKKHTKKDDYFKEELIDRLIESRCWVHPSDPVSLSNSNNDTRRITDRSERQNLLLTSITRTLPDHLIKKTEEDSKSLPVILGYVDRTKRIMELEKTKYRSLNNLTSCSRYMGLVDSLHKEEKDIRVFEEDS